MSWWNKPMTDVMQRPMAIAIMFARVMSPPHRPSCNQIISEFQTPLQNAATLGPKNIFYQTEIIFPFIWLTDSPITMWHSQKSKVKRRNKIGFLDFKSLIPNPCLFSKSWRKSWDKVSWNWTRAVRITIIKLGILSIWLTTLMLLN